MALGTLLRALARRGGLERSERRPRQALLALQARRLAVLRRHAYAHSPFYREFHAGLEDAPLHALPVLDKRLMMERFDDVVTDRALRRADLEAHVAAVRRDERYRGYRVVSSSGSSGTPALYVFSESEWVDMLASFDRGARWAGLAVRPFARTRVASVASVTSWHVSARATRSVESWWLPALRLDAADPLDAVVEALNRWCPRLLVVYPSVARVLAGEQLAGRLRIAPEVVMTGSEVLSPQAREAIERAWGVKPFDQYAATEAGGIAAECERHAGLHVFEDQLIVESVDAGGRPVPPGTMGERLLVTPLARRTQPLIRYEVTDMVRLTETPCACGRPFARIEQVAGRADEWIALRGAHGETVSVHPIVVARVLDRLPLTGWQVDTRPDALTVRVRGLPQSIGADAVAAQLHAALQPHAACVPPIRVERVEQLVHGATGKTPRVVTAHERR